MKPLPSRKSNRLTNYDYSRNGAYFVTFCTKERQCILWKQSVGAITDRPPGQFLLSNVGKITVQAIENVQAIYPGITVEKYVIMPNHVHLLLLFGQYDEKGKPVGGRSVIAPTKLSNVVRQLKGHITRQIGENLWQKGYHDHIIRNQADFDRIWKYIDENPLKWELDRYYCKPEQEETYVQTTK